MPARLGSEQVIAAPWRRCQMQMDKSDRLSIGARSEGRQ
jgi:hypothetical protein